ncbi:2Fe-2S iron-sulfur cluster-binding protein [Nocardioides bruguierae]|uniref:2Fe-2S iron-sulfur cluster-binding protein n=1 Tax=Nocardioides bruguierae TaxID=2945102 RepID=UPI0020228897|nr:hybrid-cluster NAD(P)-dependent oxidoreductase [Nocardioides bruguierae]MCL8025974.1 hybrid-cluster NAD(P)-dependent oxidoreductase [Nocardioides bruguierae]
MTSFPILPGRPVATGPGTSPAPLASTAPLATPAPLLSVVPDLPVPLGAGLLPLEQPLDQELVVRARVPETPDTVTLVLEPTRPGTFSFVPGQFLTLVVDVGGAVVERCYTIASPPTRPHLLAITVKRVPGGELSGHLHDRLAVGDRVLARGPLGRFSVTESPASSYLLLSAGSGITPALSTVRAMADLAVLGPGGTDVVLLHCARTARDLPARAEMEALAAAHPGLRLVWLLREPGEDSPYVAAGRFGPAALAALVPDVADRTVLTCGPTGFMADAEDALALAGVPAERRLAESFSLSAPDAPPVTTVPEGAARVRFGRSGREVACGPGSTVLDAAREAGVRLPSSCGAGLCGSCKSTLLAGRVDMRHQGGIRPREIAADRFLPCCSTPDGDIVVDA